MYKRQALALQSLGDDIQFNMDVENLEKLFNVKMHNIEESIRNYKKKLSGSVRSKKVATTGITFI